MGSISGLVISGPNEGNNLGVLICHSGTVGATIAALYRGIPAIAVSANGDTSEDGTQGLVARAVIKFINELVKKNHSILEPGIGINLNLPSLAAMEDIEELEFVFTSIGKSPLYIPKFTMSLGEDPFGRTVISPDILPNLVNVPAVTFTYPDKTNSLEETAKNPETRLLQEGKATISVIEASYAAGHTSEKKVKCRLQNLLHSDEQGETR